MTKMRTDSKKKYHLFILLLFLATIFMGVGYAAVNGVLLSIDGVATVLTQDVVHISAALYSSNNGADTNASRIIDFSATTLHSTVTLGNNSTSTITYAVTITNDTADDYAFSGTSYSAPDFYDNTNITYDISNDMPVGYQLLAGTSKTFYITFKYAGSNVSNPTLNSYISFNFEKYYTITYEHINTTNQNYPTTIFESETSKTITFVSDIPYDVAITPSSVNHTYDRTTGVLVISNVTANVTIDRYYSITYVTAGTVPSNQPDKYLHGATVTFLDPTNGNNIFDGWFDNQSYTGSAITNTSGLTGNLTLYAKWHSNPWQVATTYITSLVENASTSSTDVITLTTPTGATCSNLMAYDGTSDQNLRYIGADPCNYVKFNCDSDGTNCETWRIVGVMNGVGSSSLLRLAAPLSSGTDRWNTSNNKVWANASLNTSTLNTTFLNSLKTGVQTNYLENGSWFAGGSAYNANASTSYTNGKGTTTTAYIGMLSTADYGFASAGNNNTPRSTCLSTAMSSFPANCYNNDWLFQGSSLYQWSMTPQSNGNSVHRITTGGVITRVSPNQAQQASNYRPMVFLKSTIKINTETGDGSSQRPYELSYQ